MRHSHVSNLDSYPETMVFKGHFSSTCEIVGNNANFQVDWRYELAPDRASHCSKAVDRRVL